VSINLSQRSGGQWCPLLAARKPNWRLTIAPMDRPSPPASGHHQHQGLPPGAVLALLRLRASGEANGRNSHQGRNHRNHWKIQKAFASSDGRCETGPCCTPPAGLVGGDELSRSKAELARRQAAALITRGRPRRSMARSGRSRLGPRVRLDAAGAALCAQPGGGSGVAAPGNW